MANVRRQRVMTADGLIGGLLCVPSIPVVDRPLLICVHGGGCSGLYFDRTESSLVGLATHRGFPLLLVDRPGYGASAAKPFISAIDSGVNAIRTLVDAVFHDRADLAVRTPVIIGHSIGGAVALAYAADGSVLSPAAVCVSGIGDRPTSSVGLFMNSQSDGATIEPPVEWFFGPEGTYDWRSVAALRKAAEPWRRDEVDEIINLWPSRWPIITGNIGCPVHFRLAEFEQIWETAGSLDRIAGSFDRSVVVDAAIAPDGGHLYEFHRKGADLIASQLDFIEAHTR